MNPINIKNPKNINPINQLLRKPQTSRLVRFTGKSGGGGTTFANQIIIKSNRKSSKIPTKTIGECGEWEKWTIRREMSSTVAEWVTRCVAPYLEVFRTRSTIDLAIDQPAKSTEIKPILMAFSSSIGSALKIRRNRSISWSWIFHPTIVIYAKNTRLVWNMRSLEFGFSTGNNMQHRWWLLKLIARHRWFLFLLPYRK